MVTGGIVADRNILEIWDWLVHTATFRMDNQQGTTVKINK